MCNRSLKRHVAFQGVSSVQKMLVQRKYCFQFSLAVCWAAFGKQSRELGLINSKMGNLIFLLLATIIFYVWIVVFKIGIIIGHV